MSQPSAATVSDCSVVSMPSATVSRPSVPASSTIELGRNLGLEVVAEGVESETVWNWLRELGCTIAQGYHLSRPLPADELRDWMREAQLSVAS